MRRVEELRMNKDIAKEKIRSCLEAKALILADEIARENDLMRLRWGR